MPIEYEQLNHRAAPFNQCPRCACRPFRPFLRGRVHNLWRKFLRRPYCAVICLECKEIVGHEKP